MQIVCFILCIEIVSIETLFITAIYYQLRPDSMLLFISLNVEIKHCAF